MRLEMSNALTANMLQVVNNAEVEQILAIDAKSLAPNAENKFIKTNYRQAWILINTWLLIIKQASDLPTMYNVLVFMKTNGLSATIELANQVGENLVLSLSMGEDISPDGFSVFAGILGTDSIGYRLQALRYPKRFTWLNAGGLADTSINKMFEVNSGIFINESASTHPSSDIDVYNGFIIETMQCYYTDILKHFSEYFSEEIPEFSSGVCYMAKTLEEKLAYVAGSKAYWVYPGIPLTPYIPANSIAWDDPNHDNCVRCRAVPKSYKAYRIITPLKPTSACELQRARKAWEKCIAKNGFSKYYDSQTQEPNRVAALLGSCGTPYATVDMSSASDSISRNLVYRLMPTECSDIIRPYMEEYISAVMDDGTLRVATCNMFGTSGNPVTFVSESTFFLAAALTASRIYRLGYNGRITPKLLDPHIFGDDAVVDARVVDIYIDILTQLGCFVNNSKTFTTGLYKESCGEEYYGGLNVSSRYWPRKDFHTSVFRRDNLKFADTVLSLCSIQHKLWDFPEARTFLECFIRELVPDMTSSYVGTSCTDLWAITPQFAKRSAPHKGKINCDDSVTLREAHYGAATLEEFDRSENVESYLYLKFLKEGPVKHSDPLCALLGCTEPRRAVSKSKTVLKKIVK
jgi:hypothetical protein